MIWEKTGKIFRHALQPVCHSIVFSFRDAQGCAVLNYPDDKREDLRARLREGLNQLVAQQALFGAVECSLGLSAPADQPEELPVCFLEARDAVCERLLEGSGRLLEGRPAASAMAGKNLLERYGRGVELLADTLDQQEAEAVSRQLEESAMAVPDVRGRELLELVRSAGRLFALRVCGEDAGRETEEFEEQCMQCSRAPHLFACLR